MRSGKILNIRGQKSQETPLNAKTTRLSGKSLAGQAAVCGLVKGREPMNN